ncbi:MAG: ribonuclease III [Thermomicrobiales bacterium]
MNDSIIGEPLIDAGVEPPSDARVRRAEAALGVQFANPDLLRRALTHRSFLDEAGNENWASNERLEFLGDALLGFLVADVLFRRFSDLPEGQLTARRVALIRTDTLARWSRQLGVGSLLYITKGEIEPEDLSDRVLANAFEALLAAIYLDQGLDTARAFLAGRLVEADAIIARFATENYKGRLQELVQDPQQRIPGVSSGADRRTLSYAVVARGVPATESAFTVEARVAGHALGVGEGSNKRLAEQAAARDALDNLSNAKHLNAERGTRNAE